MLSTSNLWTYLLVFLFYAHINSVIYSIYVHRSLAHSSVIFSPLIEKIFRFIFWLTAKVPTNHLIAVHRHHHRLSDKPGDPNSPHTNSLYNILVKRIVFGLIHYILFVPINNTNSTLASTYKLNRPDDYTVTYPRVGQVLFIIINFILFGWYGLVLVLALYMYNVLSTVLSDILYHLIGYRNFQLDDYSHNFFPVALLHCGEELHNNHHKYPGRAKLSIEWYEFDPGWGYIWLLSKLGLAKIKN